MATYIDKMVLANGSNITTEAGTSIIAISDAWVPTLNANIETTVTEIVGTENVTTLNVAWVATLGTKVLFATTETIAAEGTTTAASLNTSVHYVDADAGWDIVTLADGTVGQVMFFIMATATGTLTLTPTTLHWYTSVTLDAVWESVQLLRQATIWRCIVGGHGYGTA